MPIEGCRSGVNPAVIFGRQDLEVFEPVVSSVPVEVVYMLTRSEASA